MRTIPGYPDPSVLVTEPVARVHWAGVWRDVVEVDVVSRWENSLPEQVAGATGMVAATADVVWSPGVLVSDDYRLPWDDGLPKKGDPVVIEMGHRDGSGVPVYARALTGVVDYTVGDAADDVVTSKIVDLTDQLNRSISIDPLHYRMPYVEDAPLMRMGLHPTYVTDRIARYCGFYATPRIQPNNSILSAPLMGSAWPERGTLTLADIAEGGGGTDPNAYPTYASTSWGLAVQNLEAHWTPFVLAGMTGHLDRSFFMRFLTGPVKGGYSRVYSRWAGVHALAVAVGTARGVDVVAMDAPGQDVQAGGGGSRFNMPLTAEEISAGVDVVVWFTPNGSNADVTIGVKMAGGEVRTATGTVAVSATIRNTRIEQVHLYSPTIATLVGGLQVGFASAPYDLHAWARTAIIETDPVGQLLGVPAIVNENCLDLLKGQAASELAAIWFDEEGRFRYRSFGRTRAEPVSGTLTFDDLSSLPWSTSWSSVRESVSVTYRHPSVDRHITYRATAWEAGSITLEGSDVYEEIVHPDANVDWINMGPLNIVRDSDPNSIYRYNLGRGSFVAGIVEYEDAMGDQQSFPADDVYLAASFTRLDARSYLFRATSSNLPAGYALNLRIPGWAKIWASRREKTMPIMRAMVVQRWDEVGINGLPLGISGTGMYEHDAKWWVQEVGPAQVIADTVAEEVSAPRPIVSGAEVSPDDRRTLGDVYTITSPARADGTVRPTIRALITGITHTFKAGQGRTQSLDWTIINS